MKLLSMLAVTIFAGGIALAQLGHADVKANTADSDKEVAMSKSDVVTGVHGTVRITDECGTYVEVGTEGEMEKYYILDPSSELNGKNGAKIVFDYQEFAGKYPEGCDFTKAIAINNIKFPRPKIEKLK